jgi:hypothetical protein
MRSIYSERCLLAEVQTKGTYCFCQTLWRIDGLKPGPRAHFSLDLNFLITSSMSLSSSPSHVLGRFFDCTYSSYEAASKREGGNSADYAGHGRPSYFEEVISPLIAEWKSVSYPIICLSRGIPMLLAPHMALLIVLAAVLKYTVFWNQVNNITFYPLYFSRQHRVNKVHTYASKPCSMSTYMRQNLVTSPHTCVKTLRHTLLLPHPTPCTQANLQLLLVGAEPKAPAGYSHVWWWPLGSSQNPSFYALGFVLFIISTFFNLYVFYLSRPASPVTRRPGFNAMGASTAPGLYYAKHGPDGKQPSKISRILEVRLAT